MKARNTRSFILVPILVSFTLTLTSCSITDLFHFESNLCDDDAARENPLFWDHAISIEDATMDGTENLYTLNNEAFTGKPYNDLCRYGENILLISQACYEETPADAEPNYEYAFELYSPWRDSIDSSISHDDTNCDGYNILANQNLLLYKYGSNKISLYDIDLELIGTYTIEGLGDNLPYSFYGSEDPHKIYTYAYNSNDLIEIHLPVFEEDEEKDAAKAASLTTIDTDIYNITIQDDMTGGGYLIINGVDKTTARETTAYYNTDLKQSQTIIEFSTFMAGAYERNNYVARCYDMAEYYVLRKSDTTCTYFKATQQTDLDILTDDRFLMRSPNYDDDNRSHLKVNLYNGDGTVNNYIDYDCSKLTSNDCYLGFGHAMFEEDGLAFYLLYGENMNPQILVWKINESTSNGESLTMYDSLDELEQTELMATYQESPDTTIPYDMLYGQTDYNWGDLTECRQKADEMEKAFGIEIYLGEQVPTEISSYQIGTELDPDTIMDALGLFEEVMNMYPKGFFKQLCYGDITTLRFYFGGSLTSSTDGSIADAAGFVTQNQQSKLMALDCEYTWDWYYTINHELSHMIDSRLEYADSMMDEVTTFSPEDWNALNPEGFTYAETYANYENYAPYKTAKNYFIDVYGTTFATEDRAELFGYAAKYYLDSDESVKNSNFNSYRLKKYTYYCECIRDSFDSTNWEAITPWEAILN